jgi:hypothetical protein
MTNPDEMVSSSSSEESKEDEEEDLADKDNAKEDQLIHLGLFEDQITSDQMPPGIIHPQSLWKTIWNAVMLVVIISLSISVPYRIAFEEVALPAWVYIDTALDFLFIIDMILNFFTALENDNGDIIIDRKKIALLYLYSWFLIDLTSSIPITLIQHIITSQESNNDSQNNLVNLRIIKLTRLPRLYRLLRLLKLIRLYKSNKFI